MLSTRVLFQRIYKAQKSWPPDFSLLSKAHQFRLERRYRRRVKLKWARPRLQKLAGLLQWGISLFVITYGVFFVDWKGEHHIFMPIRRWASEHKKSFWSTPSSEFTTKPRNPAPPESPLEPEGAR